MELSSTTFGVEMAWTPASSPLSEVRRIVAVAPVLAIVAAADPDSEESSTVVVVGLVLTIARAVTTEPPFAGATSTFRWSLMPPPESWIANAKLVVVPVTATCDAVPSASTPALALPDIWTERFLIEDPAKFRSTTLPAPPVIVVCPCPAPITSTAPFAEPPAIGVGVAPIRTVSRPLPLPSAAVKALCKVG